MLIPARLSEHLEAAACGKKGTRVESHVPRSLGTLESLAAVLAEVVCGWEPRRASLRSRAGKWLGASGSRAGGRLRNTAGGPANWVCLWGNLENTVTTCGTELNLSCDLRDIGEQFGPGVQWSNRG